MTHPRMFDPDDPVLGRVRALALALPGAAEKVSHGRPAFHTTKVFAYYGGSRKVGSEWVQHPESVVLFGDLAGQAALRARADAWVPGYLGAYGWTGVDLDDDVDWDELAELVEESYRATAPRRLVAELDRRGAPGDGAPGLPR